MKGHYSVVGWFAQEGVRIHIDPSSSEEHLYFASGRYMFHGMINLVHNTFKGMIIDGCGTAWVEGDIRYDEEKSKIGMTFIKIYKHRRDEIRYELLLNEEGLQQCKHIFRGGYSGSAVGKGDAYMCITPTPRSFFD